MHRLLSSIVLLFSLTFLAWIQENDDNMPQVLYFPNNQKNWVNLNVGTNQGYHLGDVVNSYRKLRHVDELWVETGYIKIVQASKDRSLGEIIKQDYEQAKAAFGDFSSVMAGDLIAKPSFKIEQKQILLPSFEFNFFDLFVDPKAYPSSMELSNAGKERLQAAAKLFASKAFGKLIIKGYTDSRGDEADNQIESLQRAQAIRQYLNEDLGLKDERIIAIGMGESDTKDDSQVAGSHEHNRRIVLKIIDG